MLIKIIIISTVIMMVFELVPKKGAKPRPRPEHDGSTLVPCSVLISTILCEKCIVPCSVLKGEQYHAVREVYSTMLWEVCHAMS